MKTSIFSRIARIAAGASLIAASALGQPDGLFMSGSGDLQSGIVVRFRTMIEPAMSASEMKSFNGGLNGGVSAGVEAVHRYMWDNSIYFGYDVSVTRSGPGSYSVTFLPLSISTQRMFGKSLMPAPQPHFPAPQTVQDGDTIALELFVSLDGRHKIVDYLQILAYENAEPPAASLKRVAPRDFTIDDGPVTFDISPRVTYWINGQEFAGGSRFSGKPGATLWVYFPGRERYILSLVPSPGFEKAGAVIHNVASFAADGQQYEIRFSGPIAGAEKAFNLYLARDPSYHPKPELSNTVVAGVDRLANLLPDR
jgi:hypothetical protein